jgi:hypothetical protein
LRIKNEPKNLLFPMLISQSNFIECFTPQKVKKMKTKKILSRTEKNHLISMWVYVPLCMYMKSHFDTHDFQFKSVFKVNTKIFSPRLSIKQFFSLAHSLKFSSTSLSHLEMVFWEIE